MSQTHNKRWSALHKHGPETPAARFGVTVAPWRSGHRCQERVRRGLTEGLQAGLDELLPARPLGEVTQGHGGLALGGLGRAGFVEPVRTARRRNSRPGAASWSRSPWGKKTKKNTKHKRSEGEEGLGGPKMCLFSLYLCLLAYEDVEHVDEQTIILWYRRRLLRMKQDVLLPQILEPLLELQKPPRDSAIHCSHFLPLTEGNTGWLRTSTFKTVEWTVNKKEFIWKNIFFFFFTYCAFVRKLVWRHGIHFYAPTEDAN